MKATFKTERNYFKGQTSDYCSIKDFFSDATFYYNKRGKQVYRVALPELKEAIAERFVNRVFDRKNKAEKAEIKRALIERTGDLSMFQCFYTDGSNSLSGSAYDYCKREFLKSI